MTLSGYIPELIEEDFEPLVQRAISGTGLAVENMITGVYIRAAKEYLKPFRKVLL